MPPTVLVLVMILDGGMEVDQPEDEFQGTRGVWKTNSLKRKGTLVAGLCDGRTWRETDNAHL